MDWLELKLSRSKHKSGVVQARTAETALRVGQSKGGRGSSAAELDLARIGRGCKGASSARRLMETRVGPRRGQWVQVAEADRSKSEAIKDGSSSGETGRGLGEARAVLAGAGWAGAVSRHDRVG